MIRIALVTAGLALGLTTVLAQSDPIAERKTVMKAVGAATGLGAKIAKGEEAFDAAKVRGIF
jgi:cytochrome c556